MLFHIIRLRRLTNKQITRARTTRGGDGEETILTCSSLHLPPLPSQGSGALWLIHFTSKVISISWNSAVEFFPMEPRSSSKPSREMRFVIIHNIIPDILSLVVSASRILGRSRCSVIARMSQLEVLYGSCWGSWRQNVEQHVGHVVSFVYVAKRTSSENVYRLKPCNANFQTFASSSLLFLMFVGWLKRWSVM